MLSPIPKDDLVLPDPICSTGGDPVLVRGNGADRQHRGPCGPGSGDARQRSRSPRSWLRPPQPHTRRERSPRTLARRDASIATRAGDATRTGVCRLRRSPHTSAGVSFACGTDPQVFGLFCSPNSRSVVRAVRRWLGGVQTSRCPDELVFQGLSAQRRGGTGPSRERLAETA